MPKRLTPDLNEALGMVEWLHAKIWGIFDPNCTLGDDAQPEEIKEVLLKARQILVKHGIDTFADCREAGAAMTAELP